ncbi:MAG: hypothetical protein ACRD2K_05830 [Terriglobales bacterium]
MGTLSVEVYRIYLLGVGGVTVLPFPWYYYLVSLGLALVGGFFAMSWEENKKWKCFYLGASVTTWISAFSKLHT